jgi:hypothetical protein
VAGRNCLTDLSLNLLPGRRGQGRNTLSFRYFLVTHKITRSAAKSSPGETFLGAVVIVGLYLVTQVPIPFEDMNINQAQRILGVPSGASVEEVRTRFYQRAKETHPDRTGKGEASEFIRLRAAYEDLLKFLREVDEPPRGEQSTAGDFEWEWTRREQEIRNTFERIRKSLET